MSKKSKGLSKKDLSKMEIHLSGKQLGKVIKKYLDEQQTKPNVHVPPTYPSLSVRPVRNPALSKMYEERKKADEERRRNTEILETYPSYLGDSFIGFMNGINARDDRIIQTWDHPCKTATLPPDVTDTLRSIRVPKRNYEEMPEDEDDNCLDSFEDPILEKDIIHLKFFRDLDERLWEIHDYYQENPNLKFNEGLIWMRGKLRHPKWKHCFYIEDRLIVQKLSKMSTEDISETHSTLAQMYLGELYEEILIHVSNFMNSETSPEFSALTSLSGAVLNEEMRVRQTENLYEECTHMIANSIYQEIIGYLYLAFKINNGMLPDGATSVKLPCGMGRATSNAPIIHAGAVFYANDSMIPVYRRLLYRSAGLAPMKMTISAVCVLSTPKGTHGAIVAYHEKTQEFTKGNSYDNQFTQPNDVEEEEDTNE